MDDGIGTQTGAKREKRKACLNRRKRGKNFSLSETFAGYSGWEHNASNGGDQAHDVPMVLRTDMIVHVKQFDIVAAYQYGLHDYPYHQVRLGVAYRWDVLRWKKKKD